MNVKQLIKQLENLPQDLPIRVVMKDKDENEWLYELEYSETGESGYEECGEVRLLTTE
tara:strand:+ start:1052 stop:1225 length:174 start_codon:yes stop_codon:yes gene_type:complete